MGYRHGESDIQSILQGVDGFSNTVTIANYRVLDSGVQKAIVLTYGGFSQTEPGLDGTALRWVTNIEVFIRYLEEGTSEVVLRDNLQNVLDQLSKYPALKGAANFGVPAYLVSGSEPFYLMDENGNGPFFVATRLSFSWTERGMTEPIA